jgi:hypothetical protein
MTLDQAEQYSRDLYQNARGDQNVQAVAGDIRSHVFDRANMYEPGSGDTLREAGQLVSRLHNVADAAGKAPEAQFQIPHSATGFALGQAKLRAPAIKGSVLNQIAQVAKTNPAALGKWGNYLGAAAARGPAALAATHFALSQNDSEYAASVRQALGGGNE